jgi:hypothetical protein
MPNIAIGCDSSAFRKGALPRQCAVRKGEQRVRLQNLIFSLALAASAVTVAACGGGGGGGTSGGGSGIVPATPTPTPTPVPNTISGTAVDFTSGVALVGFTVTVGSAPTATTCAATQTASSMPCGVPASPLPTVTTSSTGAFSVAVPTTGTYMLTIAKDATYATLHRTVPAAAGATSVGTVKITALSADEQAWLVDVNNQRATVSAPVSFANLVVDEYAEEQARQYASDVASGKAVYSDAAYAPYQAGYSASAGELYSVGGVEAEQPAASAYLAADGQWMGEKSNCASGNWQTCTFSATTGHYINLSNTQDVWVGLGESSVSFVVTGFPNQWLYNVMIIKTRRQLVRQRALGLPDLTDCS